MTIEIQPVRAVYWAQAVPARCDIGAEAIGNTFARGRTVRGKGETMCLKCARVWGAGAIELFRRQADESWLRCDY